MPDTTQPAPSGDFITITVRYTGSGVTIEQQFPPHLSENLITIGLGTAIHKLMELYDDRLSARNSP